MINDKDIIPGPAQTQIVSEVPGSFYLT